jgi:hypothetical protein
MLGSSAKSAACYKTTHSLLLLLLLLLILVLQALCACSLPLA